MFNEYIYRDLMKRQGKKVDGTEMALLRLSFAAPVTPLQSAVRWALVSGFLAGVSATLIVLTLLGRMSWH